MKGSATPTGRQTQTLARAASLAGLQFLAGWNVITGDESAIDGKLDRSGSLPIHCDV